MTARGTISAGGGIRRITIEFPFRNMYVEGVTKSFKQRDQIILGLQDPLRRINELTDVQIGQHITETSIILLVESLKNTIFWRNVNALMRGKSSFSEFEIPEQVFQANIDIQKEFVRGYADVAGYARASNRDQAGRHRVYLDVLNANWYLPVQLCHLLQDYLKVPTQTITYGHPNLRDPQGKDYKSGKRGTWAREHQYKTYCEHFERIGFYMKHKQEILEELAEHNKQKIGSIRTNFCSPPKALRGKKYKHPEVKSDKLPSEIRRKQYRSYWQICADLHCPRYQEWLKTQTKLALRRASKRKKATK